MLGEIIRGLTDPATAEEVVTAVGQAALVERVRDRAAAANCTVGGLVATRIGDLIERGAEELWIGLLGAMAATPQPAAAAVDRLLMAAFPDPHRVVVRRAAN